MLSHRAVLNWLVQNWCLGGLLVSAECIASLKDGKDGPCRTSVVPRRCEEERLSSVAWNSQCAAFLPAHVLFSFSRLLYLPPAQQSKDQR